MEADLQHHYNVDLAGLWRGELSIRRLSVLIANLPPTSATALRYAPAPGWDIHAYLLADLFKAFTGEDHPARPVAATTSRYSELRARLAAQKARLAQNN